MVGLVSPIVIFVAVVIVLIIYTLRKRSLKVIKHNQRLYVKMRMCL